MICGLDCNKCHSKLVYIQRNLEKMASKDSVVDTFQVIFVRLQLHVAIYRPDSFVLMLRYCANLKAIRYESMS